MLYAPPPQAAGVDAWGQPSRSAEVAGRPLGSTLHVFRSGKAVTIPTWHGLRLSTVAATMKTGELVSQKARLADPLLLVPTTGGGICIQGPTFQTCHRGLLRTGVTYTFQVTDQYELVFGIAADDVTRVSLGARSVTVHDNVFVFSRPLKLTSAAHLPKTFGTLTVSYRGGRPPARVAIR
jgi:hypothetical protein